MTNHISHWAGKVLVPCTLLLAIAACQEEYDMELSPVGGSSAAAKVAGTYSGTWKRVAVAPDGSTNEALSGEGTGTIELKAGTSGVWIDAAKKEITAEDNPNAAQAFFRCETLEMELQENVNVAPGNGSSAFFNKFDTSTQVEAAFAGSVSDQGTAIVKFIVKHIETDDWTGENFLYLYHYEFTGQR